jgi:hypothetical protein
MKNPNDPIGNRTHYLPACSAVSQPTTPLRTFSMLSDAKCLLYNNINKYVIKQVFWQCKLIAVLHK